MGLFSFIKNIFIDPRMEADEKIPLRRFSRSAIAIITGGDDYGYLPKDKVVPLLNEAWEVRSTEDVEKTVRELAKENDAWNLVRAIHVARMGSGAGFITVERSWELVAPVAAKLQRAYASWNAVAEDYYKGRTEWAAATGSDHPDREEFDDEIEVIKDVYWEEMPFKHDLTAQQF